MKAYLDSSVIVAAVLQENSRPAIERFLLTRPALATSDLCRGELAAAIGRKVIGGELPRDRGESLIRTADQWQSPWLKADCLPEDFRRAHDHVLRFELKLRFPDALHIALAERLGYVLVSMDKRQLAAAATLGNMVLDLLAVTPDMDR